MKPRLSGPPDGEPGFMPGPANLVRHQHRTPPLRGGLEMRLTAREGRLKGSSTRSIAWSELVVRGGVEPPTFRFQVETALDKGAR